MTVPKTTSLSRLADAAADCTMCELYRDATRTVFGEGPRKADIVLVGEQPGDLEDQHGHPFVGPAGRLLRELMQAAGLDPAKAYLTNTVKHFKYLPRGNRRLHQRANAAEQAACRPWLAAELLRVRPRVVLALGAMAAQTVFGAGFRLTASRGQWHRLDADIHALASWHPSAILRMRSPQREQTRALLLDDLRAAAAALRGHDGNGSRLSR